MFPIYQLQQLLSTAHLLKFTSFVAAGVGQNSRVVKSLQGADKAYSRNKASLYPTIRKRNTALNNDQTFFFIVAHRAQQIVLAERLSHKPSPATISKMATYLEDANRIGSD